MCETSNTPHALAHRRVLLAHALVLHGHLPAGELDELGPGVDVAVVQGGAAQGRGHG